MVLTGWRGGGGETVLLKTVWATNCGKIAHGLIPPIIRAHLWKNNERMGAEEISQLLCGDELKGRCTPHAFQSLVPTGIALQYTAVEEGIVACLIFWGDVVLIWHVQGLLRTGGWSSPEGCLSLVSEAMTRIFIQSATRRCIVRWAGCESNVQLMAAVVEAKKVVVVVVMGRECEGDVEDKRAYYKHV